MSYASYSQGDATQIRVGKRPYFAVLIASLAMAIVLAGCAIRLAPDFDRTIVDGLGKANEETMVLFASMANGTSAATFGKRKPTYDSLIGKFDALRLQAIARPVPRLPGAQIFARGGGLLANPEKLQSPTPDFLAAVILTLAFMSEADAEFDLRPSDVKRFKNEFEASMSQALTYEKALER